MGLEGFQVDYLRWSGRSGHPDWCNCFDNMPYMIDEILDKMKSQVDKRIVFLILSQMIDEDMTVRDVLNKYMLETSYTTPVTQIKGCNQTFLQCECNMQLAKRKDLYLVTPEDVEAVKSDLKNELYKQLVLR